MPVDDVTVAPVTIDFATSAILSNVATVFGVSVAGVVARPAIIFVERSSSPSIAQYAGTLMGSTS